MTGFDPTLQIVDRSGLPTSYFEDIIYQLSHIPEGSPGSSDAGEKGQLLRDANFVYICYDTDMWGRISFTTGY